MRKINQTSNLIRGREIEFHPERNCQTDGHTIGWTDICN